MMIGGSPPDIVFSFADEVNGRRGDGLPVIGRAESYQQSRATSTTFSARRGGPPRFDRCRRDLSANAHETTLRKLAKVNASYVSFRACSWINLSGTACMPQ